MGDNPSRQSQLTHISTLWSLVFKAHAADPAIARSSQAKLIERYAPALHQYLLAVLHDPHAADEVFQEFTLRLLRGSFAAAHPERGRFRDYLKAAITHLIVDFRRRQQRHRQERKIESVVEAVSESAIAFDSDRAFLESWRQELLSRTWDRLAEHEHRTGQPYFQILRLRSEHPQADSTALAALLSQQLRLPQPITSVNARKLLQRARQQFSDALLDEVEQSLRNPALDELEQELIDLALYEYCRSALRRRAATSPGGGAQRRG